MSVFFSQVGKFGRSRRSAAMLLVTFVSVIAIILFSSVSTATTFNNNLVDAADIGDVGLVQKFLKQGQLPDSRGDFGTTALMRAAFRGNTDIIQILMENGAYVNAADVGGETALHLAAKNGHDDAVNALLYYGAYIDVPDKEKWTPLMRATLAKQPDTVKALLDKGADINALNSINESVLIHAAIAGVPEIATMILGSPKAGKIPLEQENMAIGLAKRKNHGKVEKIIASFMENPPKEPEAALAMDNTPQTKNKPAPQFLKNETSLPINKPITPPLEKPATKPSQDFITAKPETKPETQTMATAAKQLSQAADASPYPSNAELPPPSPQKVSEAVARNAKSLLNEAKALPATKTSPLQPSKIPLAKPLKSGTGSVFYVQLGTFDDDHSAEVAWDKILPAASDALSTLDPVIVEAHLSTKPGDVAYRLRAGTMPTKAAADDTCANLRARKMECYVVEITNVSTSTATAKAAPLPLAKPPAVAMRPDSFAGSYPKLGPSATLPQAPLDITPKPSVAANAPEPQTAASAQSLPWLSSDAPVRKEWALPANAVTVSAPPKLAQAVQPAPTLSSFLPDNSTSSQFPTQQQLPPLPENNQAAPTFSNETFVQNKEAIRDEVQEMTRENFFRKQGLEPPQRKKKEYDDFYKQVESNPHESSVSEAVMVPDETYFSGGGNSSPLDTTGVASWLNIYNLPNEAFAKDYGTRMFKYDESLGNVQVMVSNSGGSTTMRVGPLMANKAESLCTAVKAGGYGCNVVGGSGVTNKSITRRDGDSFASQAPDKQYWINLGTFPSSSEAEYYWMFVKEDNGDILNSLEYDASNDGAGPVKLRTGPFNVKQRAAQICSIMRYRNIACLVAD